ncbi:M23 family metallopeptidase [Sphingomonas sp. RP10(2022)]|uniref:M23 family metallopeptidase n=1 Tax=Sphingomonas liriopis TaxID=2949094 RepID=A0A9X2KNZ1_9SPHN|nr:M23 family metallopeptidase [Sphingomonas liriopis]MCP3733377.1 M23 family metallopeptidase [Sphingomonas liriopis]
MTRLGWIILAVVLLFAAAFVSMTSFGTADRRMTRVDTPPPPPAETTAGPLVVPVAGVRRETIVDSWGDPRGGGTRGHHGTDIPAAQGTPVIAAASGTVEKLFRSVRGGTTAYVRSTDRRWIYYYAHLAAYAPGLREGQPVRAGQQIGNVGDTGDAGQGNYHLHFGMQRMRPGERWYQGEDVDPYPMLAARARGR